MTGRQIDQERRNGKWRKAFGTPAVGGTHRVSNRRKATDTGGNHGCGALLLIFRIRCPACLTNGLIGRRHRQQNKAVHFLLVFWRYGAVGIKTCLGILLQ
ncbi:hypothetical protein D3C80_1287720 [compost metagenome]